MIAKQNYFRPRQPRYWSVSLHSRVGLIYGPHNLQVEIAGLTVAETNLAFKDFLNVGADAEAYVNASGPLGLIGCKRATDWSL